jgi:hypothetical protein
MRRAVLALALAGLLTGMTASAALAMTTKIPPGASAVPNASDEHVISGVGSVAPQIHGDVYSVRGEVHTAYLTDVGGSVPIGQQTSIVNSDLDIVTGVGRVWGTSHLVLPGDVGGFDCHFVGTTTAWFLVWEGQSACHGYGGMVGYQTRGTLASAPFGSTFAGYLFTAGNE